jgi:hypothetical protein
MSVISVTSLLGLGVNSRAQADCTNASLKGTFGYSCQGTLGSFPAVEVGIATYDGKGNGSGKSTFSLDGTILQGVPWTGTYTLNADCTGSVTFADGTHADLVLDDHKSELRLIVSDSGNVYTCLKKQR